MARDAVVGIYVVGEDGFSLFWGQGLGSTVADVEELIPMTQDIKGPRQFHPLHCTQAAGSDAVDRGNE